MAKFKDEQFEVFNAFEDLRAFGVGEEQWPRVVEGEPLQWPSSALDAQTTLYYHKHRVYDLGSFATLLIKFAEPASTIFVFNPESGRIDGVHRFVGDVAASDVSRSFLRVKVGRLLVRNYRTQKIDYQNLVSELRAGREYHQYKG